MDPAALVSAADRWGTPLYLTDLDAVCANLALYRVARSDALIAYAVKANPDPILLRRLVAEGAGCEVVNHVELALALRAGCRPERIVMNGVGKTDSEIEVALGAGVLVNAESLDELTALLRFATPSSRVGLRLNPGLEADTHPHLATGAADSKFGIGLADLDVARERCRAAGVPLTSIGSHIGSDIASAGLFLELAALLGAAAEPGEWIDLGGGLADAVSAGELAGLLPGRRLIVEPGRSLVADAGWLVLRVIRAQPREGATWLIGDAGMTELLRPMLYGADHPVALLAPGGPVSGVVHLAGPVCEAGDVLSRDLSRWLSPAEVGRCGPGALLAIGRAGAYGAAMASNYNGRLRPAEAVIDGGELRLSRRRETLEDLLARDA